MSAALARWKGCSQLTLWQCTQPLTMSLEAILHRQGVWHKGGPVSEGLSEGNKGAVECGICIPGGGGVSAYWLPGFTVALSAQQQLMLSMCISFSGGVSQIERHAVSSHGFESIKSLSILAREHTFTGKVSGTRANLSLRAFQSWTVKQRYRPFSCAHLQLEPAYKAFCFQALLCQYLYSITQ